MIEGTSALAASASSASWLDKDLQSRLSSRPSGHSARGVRGHTTCGKWATAPGLGFIERLPDGTGNGRAYNSHQVADMLTARADRIEKGETR